MGKVGLWLRVWLACALTSLISIEAIAETCNGGQDNASGFHMIEGPGSLQPGVPAHVRLSVNNIGPNTWVGETSNPAFRLGATSGNQVIWSNFRCNGFSRSATDQRAFLCSAVSSHTTAEFEFDVMAPTGSTGTAKLGVQMVYDAGTACDGWFGASATATFTINGTPSCNNSPLSVSNDQWRLEVWNNRNLSGNTVEQKYVGPNGSGGFQFDWGGGVSACAGQSEYSTRLTRNVYLDPGHYTFQVHGDDGVRLTVGGARIVDQWRDPQYGDFTATLDITTSGYYTIELQHYQATGGSGVGLSWSRQDNGGPPAAPSGLVANGGNGKVDLGWSGSTGATSYNVKRSTTSGSGYSTIASSSTTGYTDFGVSNGTTYYYVVTAVNSRNEESGPSAQASAMPSSGPTNPTCSNASLSVPSDSWLLEIYNNTDLAGEPVERRYDSYGPGGFNFQWGGTAPSACVQHDNYSVRFKRMASFSQSGTWRFDYTTDDGMRGWVDGTQVFNRWAVQSINGSDTLNVSQGTHLVEVQYYQASGGAQAVLSWNFEGGPTPQPPAAPTGVHATTSNSLVTLQWSAVSGSNPTYHVKRSAAACCYLEIGATQSLSFADHGVSNGTTYHYVVSAETTDGGEGPNSADVPATPQAPASGPPEMKLELLDPAGNVISANALTLNSDGWPSPNPLQVRVTLHCPAERTQGCNDNGVDIQFNSTNSAARMSGLADSAACNLAPGNIGTYTFLNLRWRCAEFVGFPVAAGQSVQLIFRIVIAPSDNATFTIRAIWGEFASAGRDLFIPRAQIHPVIVIPGILGTMPPWVGAGELDPVLGVYDSLLEQFKRFGLEEGHALFRMPYDWRNSNRVTARNLRDRIREVLAASATIPYVAQDGKVDLVVHSMGGLITRIYAQGEGLEANGTPLAYNGDIRKVVFMGTPHRGFPEDYKTYEGGSWYDFLYDNPFPRWAMDGVFWPAFITKHWQQAHPNQSPPYVCLGSLCSVDRYTMTHDTVGGIDSMREMLPTDDSDTFFGPYLCDSYNGSVCTGAYKYGKQFNPILNRLNANVGLLDARIGAANLYVVYGTDPSPSNNTDVVYDVKAGPATPILGMVGWANGEPEQNFVTAAGDDLIPEYSANLKLLLPSIPDTNIAHLKGEAGRHLSMMYNPEVQYSYLPRFLAGLGQLPFYTTYSKPVFLIDPHQWWVLAGLCPINLTITDPQGRRIGYDPATGNTVNEIPGMYAAKNSENQFIILKDPAPGAYTVTATAFGDGAYSLGLHQLTPAGTPRRWLGEGTIHNGETVSWTVSIDPTTPIVQHNPVANAGPDQKVSVVGDACRANVRLDGSASMDPDGEALTFHWTGPFGYATGAQPLVSLPIGAHEIRLVVEDGQRGASQAKTRVSVTAPSPEVKSLTATPSVLQPADGTLRDVTVTADLTTVCGVTPTCRIVDVDMDEGDKHDWQIVGALKVKLRAQRSGEGDGRTYKLRIQCQIPGHDTVHKTVNVKVLPPGRMKGSGTIKHDEKLYKFDFDVSESKGGKDAGNVKLDVRRFELDDDNKKQDDHTYKFRSTGALQVEFRNDDDYTPAGNAKVDVVKVTGSGEWDGKSGYTFEMKAIDDGEPGRSRDRFKIVVRDSHGKSVASVNEEIDSGNIQSSKPPK
jgi:pimeloyl-ACP methyl ester carboxylesterase